MPAGIREKRRLWRASVSWSETMDHLHGDHGRERSTVFHVRRYYLSGKKHYAFLSLNNVAENRIKMIYELIDGLSFPVYTRVVMKRYPDVKARSILKRIGADRISDQRLTSESNRPLKNKLEIQLRSLELLSMRVTRDGDALFQVSMTFVVSGSHPADLNGNLRRFARAMSLLGFDLTHEPVISRRRVGKLVNPLGSHGSRYIMDSRSVSSIIPLYYESNPPRSGLLLGIDAESEKPVFADPFGGNSYNSVVVGETGSGKSFFSKLLLMRALLTGMAESVLVIDPMGEYGSGLFSQSSTVIGEEDLISANGKIIDKASFSRLNIIRQSPDEMERRSDLLEATIDITNRFLRSGNGARKIILIDEAHTYFKSARTTSYLDAIYRSSRHYNASVISISQNLEDFTGTSEGKSMLSNSSMNFIFRNKDRQRNGISFLTSSRFGEMRTDLLPGGKRDPYSECYFYRDGMLRRLRIICTTREAELIGHS